MDQLQPSAEPRPVVPDRLPVLRRGKHHDPAQGACFMEYTSVLAGEPFGDRPRCVDGELAAVLRGVNDKLSDADRACLVPLLGRAIGLAVEPPPPGPRGIRQAARRYRREVTAPYRARVARLRREAARRFATAVGPATGTTRTAWSGRDGELAQFFWETMSEPAASSSSRVYVRRLVERLRLLHECYEQAAVALGLPRPATGTFPVRTPEAPAAADRGVPGRAAVPAGAPVGRPG